MSDESQFPVRIRTLVYHHELKALREKYGYTQAEVAKMCHMHPSQYGDIELLKRYPHEEEAVAIADLFEVKPEDLFPKWTMVGYRSGKRVEDRVINIQRVALDSPEVKLLEAPDEMEASIDRNLLYETLDEVMETLTPRERRVIELRYGLGDRNDQQMTFDELGREFGVSKERIRQIEAKAIRKLRHPRRATRLRGFW